MDSGFFKVQARTCRAKGDGTATVFCACAAREQNSSTVQLDLNDEGKTRCYDKFDVIKIQRVG